MLFGKLPFDQFGCHQLHFCLCLSCFRKAEGGGFVSLHDTSDLSTAVLSIIIHIITAIREAAICARSTLIAFPTFGFLDAHQFQ